MQSQSNQTLFHFGKIRLNRLLIPLIISLRNYAVIILKNI